MVARLYPKKQQDGRRKNGGARPGAGAKLGTVPEAKRVAIAQARRTGSGLNPHELLRKWADEGTMTYCSRAGVKERIVELTPGDRISCAKGCAAWYKPALQPVRAPGDVPAPVVVTLDERVLAALGQADIGRVQMLREVVAMLGVDASALGPGGAQVPKPADPARYAATLRRDTRTAGSA